MLEEEDSKNMWIFEDIIRKKNTKWIMNLIKYVYNDWNLKHMIMLKYWIMENLYIFDLVKYNPIKLYATNSILYYCYTKKFFNWMYKYHIFIFLNFINVYIIMWMNYK